MPEVALVELPPKKPGRGSCQTRSCDDSNCDPQKLLTLLVKNNNISASEVDCVRSAQSGHWKSLSARVAQHGCGDDDNACSGQWHVIEPRTRPSPGEWDDLQPPPTTMTLGAIVNDPLNYSMGRKK